MAVQEAKLTQQQIHKVKRENFVTLILKNDFFREQLLKTFNGMCANCLTDVGDTILGKVEWHAHHTNYRHSCKYLEIDCEKCYTESPHNFIACLGRILPLCKSCHFKRHKRKIARKNRKANKRKRKKTGKK